MEMEMKIQERQERLKIEIPGRVKADLMAGHRSIAFAISSALIAWLAWLGAGLIS